MRPDHVQALDYQFDVTADGRILKALREVASCVLRAAVDDPGALSKPIEEQRRDALGSRPAHLAQFAPAFSRPSIYGPQ